MSNPTIAHVAGGSIFQATGTGKTFHSLFQLLKDEGKPPKVIPNDKPQLDKDLSKSITKQ